MKKKFICTVCGYVHEGDQAPNVVLNAEFLLRNSKKSLITVKLFNSLPSIISATVL